MNKRTTKKCRVCGAFVQNAHFNRKYCVDCAKIVKSRQKSWNSRGHYCKTCNKPCFGFYCRRCASIFRYGSHRDATMERKRYMDIKVEFNKQNGVGEIGNKR